MECFVTTTEVSDACYGGMFKVCTNDKC